MSSDFLSAGPSEQDATNGVGGFADALLARFGSNSVQNVSGHEFFVNPPPPVADRAPSRALPALALPRMPTALPNKSSVASTPSATGPSPQLAAFDSTSPEGLQTLLADSACLVIDLRPHVQYANARLPHAMSLSVPSTLLKRPAFSLSKLADMLPTSARSRLSQWSSATRVLVYDADGAPPSQSSNIGGILNKFVTEGCPPSKLTWLKGGFQNVWRHHRELVDADPPSDDDDEASGNEGDEPARGTLQSRQLPLAAFTSSSTTASKQLSAPRLEAPRSAPHVAFNPFFDAIRQNLELSQGITERIPLRFPQSVLDRADDLPFRWLRELVRHASAEDVPSGTKDQMEESSETLAMQFYRIELAEQRRLTGIMQHHSKQGTSARLADPSESVPFPYSITAGVEKGAKNRYRNIWPFEHARVRLQQIRPTDDDYINASYVQPLGTNKRYIATQGPLPATFDDFWALVWEQNVHVIVMLTREIEGAQVKCGKYWVDGAYGPLRLRQISSTGGTPETDSDVRKPDAGAAGFFASSVPNLTTHTGSATVCRTFELSHTGFPKARPRRISQLHYLDWPDMNVPDSPKGLLELVRDVNHAQTEVEVDAAAERARAASARDWKGAGDEQACMITGIARHALSHQPVLLHCSAGVGRTGGFIAVDAVLDGIRRELKGDETSDIEDTEMAVDSSGSGEERELQTIPVEVSTPMDVDVPGTNPGVITGQPGQRHEAQAEFEGPSLARSLHKPRRPSGGAVWAKNDPRRMPLRKWLVATNEAATRETQLASAVPPTLALDGAPIVPSPSPTMPSDASSPQSSNTSSPNSSASDLSSPSPGSAFPQVNSLHKTLPSQPLARLHPDSHRVRASSAPSIASGIYARRLAHNTSGLCEPQESTSSLGTSSTAGPSLFSAKGGSATSMTSPPPASSVLSSDASACPPSSGPTDTFDYTAPRRLHTNTAPCALSTLSEPIRAVIEDVREQRMSLCQSLRQYVFVHQAIVEGALALVDELRAAPPRTRTASGVSTTSGSTAQSASTAGIKASMRRPSLSKGKRRRSTMDADALRDAGATLSKRPSIKRERIVGGSHV